jgi:hypothetical protein
MILMLLPYFLEDIRGCSVVVLNKPLVFPHTAIGVMVLLKRVLHPQPYKTVVAELAEKPFITASENTG